MVFTKLLRRTCFSQTRLRIIQLVSDFPFPVVLMWLFEIKRTKENGGKSYEAIMCQAQLTVDGILNNLPESRKIGLHLLKQFRVSWPLLILNQRFIIKKFRANEKFSFFYFFTK